MNHIEIFNEITLLIGGYHTIGFTPMCDDSEIRYLVGWSMIGVTILNIVINVIIMLQQLFRDFLVTLKQPGKSSEVVAIKPMRKAVVSNNEVTVSHPINLGRSIANDVTTFEIRDSTNNMFSVENSLIGPTNIEGQNLSKLHKKIK